MYHNILCDNYIVSNHLELLVRSILVEKDGNVKKDIFVYVKKTYLFHDNFLNSWIQIGNSS